MDASTILVRSPLASYSFTSSKGTNLHVCYQDKSGNIKQTFYEAGFWKNSPNGVVGKADLNNGLAITGWDSGNEVYELSTVCSFRKYLHSLGTCLLRRTR